jgi:glycosyltransferase involved in cell wall biosynthesis
MIAIYVHEIAATGVVRNALALAARFAADGRRTRLVTALPARAVGIPAGVDHVALLDRSGARLSEKCASVLALRRELHRSRPRVLISAGNHGHATVWAATRGMRAPARIYRISNDTVRVHSARRLPDRIAHLPRRVMPWLIARDAAHVVLVSPTLQAEPAYRRLVAIGQASVIPNGVDLIHARAAAAAPSPHHWLDDDVPVVIAIGRLSAQKNHATLITAVAKLAPDVPVRLIILGASRDDARERSMAQAAALGLAGRVALPGTTDNVFAWLSRAAVFVLPSWWEGAPNVLLEAIAVGVPVIASRTAGNAADILGDGRFGRLFDPADAGALAAAIRAQLDPATVVLPGDGARAYSSRNMLDRWSALADALHDGG